MDSRGHVPEPLIPGSREGAVNRSLEDAIEIEPAPIQSPGSVEGRTHSHKRGLSESANLLPSSPTHPNSRAAPSENQTLLPTSSKNLFEYSTTKLFRYDLPEQSLRGGAVSPPFPETPQTLIRPRKELLKGVVADVLAFGVSLPFFALAGALIYFNGKNVEEYKYNILDQCIRGAATLFPLCFSVVVGRAMIKIASWKLERGSSLGLLERLMGSRTVGGTLITQFRLRSFTWVGLVLILVWALSPAGSQTVLRILSTTTHPVPSFSNVTYVNSRQPSSSGTPVFNTWFSGFAAMFTASLVAPQSVKNGPIDLWGNVKIPYFSSLGDVPEDNNGWRQIPSSNFSPIYSSLFGIPASGAPTGNTTFNIQSSYMELSCANRTSNITRGPFRDFSWDFYNPGLISTKGPFLSAQNVTARTPWAVGYVGENVTSLLHNASIASLDSLPSNTAALPGLLLYQDFTGTENVTSIFCVPSQVYVESTVTCDKTPTSNNCAITAQRLSLLPNTESTITSFSILQTFLGLSSGLPNVTRDLNNIDLMQNYIVNPSSNTFIQSAPWPAFDPSSTTGESRFLDLSLQDFGTRLGQIINTFLQGSIANSTQFLTGDITPTSLTHPTPDDSQIYTQIQALSTTIAIEANTTTTSEIYTISWPYLSIFLLATTILPAAVFISAILSRQILTRDYLGYVSSLARESQFVDTPSGGVTMDGMQRSRQMRELRIRLGDVGDVDGGCEIGTGVALRVGRVAIGGVGGVNERVGNVRALDRRKLYV